jgi:putative nucleotidyltransferase with HDIG domain
MRDTSTGRVLVIDDDPGFGGMVAELLVERGFQATSVADPVEALRQIGEGGFAAAVVDLVMPQMSGLEVAERIREVSPETQTVILTGHADMDSAVEGIRHGVFDYLQKASLAAPRLWHSVEGAVEKWHLLRRNLELVDALADSNRLLEALHTSARAIAAEHHLDRLLEQVVGEARSACGAAGARVLLLSETPSGDFVVSAAAGDGSGTLRGMRLHPGKGLATLALERGETLLIADPVAHSRFDPRSDALASVGGLLVAPLSHDAVRGVLLVAGSRRATFGPPEREALATLAQHATVAIENALQQERAVNFFTHTSNLLVEFLEAVDLGLPGHSHGVAMLADLVTRRMGMSEIERRNVHFGALLHDVGKVRIDPALVQGHQPLSTEGRELMRRHPALGLDVLQPITAWEEVLAIVHAHHERWDGAGYPRGLAGEEIPQGARVVAIAEAYDAMARPAPLPRERHPKGPLAELEACAGTQFDPLIVRLFVATIREKGDPRGVAAGA